MKQYDFTLKFRLNNAEENAEKYIASLGQNGCDDALIGIGKLGRISLNFTREADDAFAAITSAITDVKNVIPGAVLVEANPDFVGITDIAEVYGASRQYIRKVVLNQAASFPEPVYEGNPSLWHLADVLGWLTEHEPKKLNRELFEVSELNMQINLYKSLLRRAPAYFAEAPLSNNTVEWDRFFRSAFGTEEPRYLHRRSQ